MERPFLNLWHSHLDESVVDIEFQFISFKQLQRPVIEAVLRERLRPFEYSLGNQHVGLFDCVKHVKCLLVEFGGDDIGYCLQGVFLD